MKKYIFALCALVFVAIGGFFAGAYPHNSAGAESALAVKKSSGHPLINPTVTAGLEKHFIINVQPLKEQFMSIQKQYAHKTYLYFAYLNNDSWVGLSEREYFTAASTIKIPLAMSVMRAVETGKLSLEDKYTITFDDLDVGFGTFHERAEGKTVSIRELVRIMLEESDNTAMQSLIHVLQNSGSTDPFEQVYAFMGWDNYPGLGEAPEYFAINLKVLSNMFLALYNARYVNADHSQEILHYLDNANFNEQIVAGVPHSIAVAHKSGVQTESQTYSDCGIVYVPNRHYLLCLGSEGSSKDIADAFMKEASKAAYEFVINN